MKTSVIPIEIASKVVAGIDNAEVVVEGLRILRICGEVGDLAKRSVNGSGGFGSILTEFIEAIENGVDPKPALAKFPEWAVTLNKAEVDLPRSVVVTQPGVSLQSNALIHAKKLGDTIMGISIIFEVDQKDFNLDISQNKDDLRLLSSRKDTQHVSAFLLKLQEFYDYTELMIKDYYEKIADLDTQAKKTFDKQHWDRMVKIKEEAEALAKKIPE